MITKGIIVSSKDDIIDEKVVTTYKVRLPLYDGYSSSDSNSDSELSDAVCCLPPHMHRTKFNKNDLVYVGMEDLDLSYPVILGMAPIASTDSLKGGLQTPTQLSMDSILDFHTVPEGTAVLPYNIKIRASENVKDYQKEEKNFSYSNTDVTPYVDGAEISCLRGTDAPILTQINVTNTSISRAFNEISNTTILVVVDGLINPDSVTVDKTAWVDSGQYPSVDMDYEFKYNSDTGKYESTLYHNRPDRTYTQSTFKDKLGVTLSASFVGNSIIITLKSGPVKIEKGGTAASTTTAARYNLELLKDCVISADDFSDLSTYDANTIYYIY